MAHSVGHRTDNISHYFAHSFHQICPRTLYKRFSLKSSVFDTKALEFYFPFKNNSRLSSQIVPLPKEAGDRLSESC